LLSQILKKSTVFCFAGLGLALCAWSRHDGVSTEPSSPAVGEISTSLIDPSRQPDDGLRAELTGAQTSYYRHAYVADAVDPQNYAIETTSADSSSERPIINMLPSVAKPLEMADLSAPTDGALVKLNVSEGDQVQQGSLLAVTDDRITAASYRVAEASASREASLAVAKAKQTLAEQYLTRITQTFSEKAASGLELDEARSRLDEAKATLLEGHELRREAIARLELEQARLDDHRLHAPFSGTVTRIKKHIGETLSRDEILLTLINLSRLRAELNVPVQYIDHFPRGSAARLIAKLPKEPLLQAKVVHVDPMIDAATNTIRIVVEIDNSIQKLPAGFAVQLIDPIASPTLNTPDLIAEN
jgi:membrane fusion protein, multidrug efflux system